MWFTLCIEFWSLSHNWTSWITLGDGGISLVLHNFDMTHRYQKWIAVHTFWIQNHHFNEFTKDLRKFDILTFVWIRKYVSLFFFIGNLCKLDVIITKEVLSRKDREIYIHMLCECMVVHVQPCSDWQPINKVHSIPSMLLFGFRVMYRFSQIFAF